MILPLRSLRVASKPIRQPRVARSAWCDRNVVDFLSDLSALVLLPWISDTLQEPLALVNVSKMQVWQIR